MQAANCSDRCCIACEAPESPDCAQQQNDIRCGSMAYAMLRGISTVERRRDNYLGKEAFKKKRS